jgi:hypothetical protein
MSAPHDPRKPEDAVTHRSRWLVSLCLLLVATVPVSIRSFDTTRSLRELERESVLLRFCQGLGRAVLALQAERSLGSRHLTTTDVPPDALTRTWQVTDRSIEALEALRKHLRVWNRKLGDDLDPLRPSLVHLEDKRSFVEARMLGERQLAHYFNAMTASALDTIEVLSAQFRTAAARREVDSYLRLLRAAELSGHEELFVDTLTRSSRFHPEVLSSIIEAQQSLLDAFLRAASAEQKKLLRDVLRGRFEDEIALGRTQAFGRRLDEPGGDQVLRSWRAAQSAMTERLGLVASRLGEQLERRLTSHRQRTARSQRAWVAATAVILCLMLGCAARLVHLRRREAAPVMFGDAEHSPMGPHATAPSGAHTQQIRNNVNPVPTLPTPPRIRWLHTADRELHHLDLVPSVQRTVEVARDPVSDRVRELLADAVRNFRDSARRLNGAKARTHSLPI